MAEIKVPIQVNLPDDWVEQIVNRLRNDPEAEWVEIIRCKDCKHWREGTAFSYCDKLYGMGVLDALDYMVAEDDYCSMAEKGEPMSKCIDKEELKPCPFCGGEAEICSAFENKFLGKCWYIRCKTCYSRGSGIYESGKELEPNQEYEAIKGAWDKAIKAWNRRAEDE